MTTAPHSMPRATRERAGGQSLRLPFGMRWTTLALFGIVVLAAVLRFANISAIGQANTYYTAATESMLQSWHNFFFVAAEPGGSVSIDKPPVGLWLQAISAYFLGVNGFAVVLPQILAGIFSVALLFHLVRRWFGDVAGLIAAFALAVTPVAIAVERNNTPDATLILTLLLAAWAFIKATETTKLRYVLIGAALVGIGFNIKMMQAFLPLPAFYALYFFGSQQGWWRKIGHLAAATVLLLAVSLSWATIVDLTPADQRPYVGSSQTNSVYNLMFGYNGLQRLEGGMGGGGSGAGTTRRDDGNRTSDAQAQTTAPVQIGNGQTTQDANNFPIGAPTDTSGMDGGRGGFGGGGVGGGMFGTGERGVLRLFQSGLAAQVSWLLPFGLLMIVAMACTRSWRKPHTQFHRGLILWGGWLLTCAVFFSVAGFFHQYYLAMLGAPLAAIVAMGVVFIWRMRATHPTRATLLMLAAVIVTLGYQVYAVSMYNALAWWVAVSVVLAAVGLGALLISLRRDSVILPRLGLTLAVAALLVVPTVWSGYTNAYSSGGGLPEAYSGGRSGGVGRMFQRNDGNELRSEVQAGNAAQSRNVPQPVDGASDNGGPGGGGRVNENLLNYLQANTQDTKYLMVVPSSQAGSEYVLATGRPVLYAGGFSGSDPVIDGDSLAELVSNGEVRYVLWGGGGPGGNSKSSITSYLQSSCSVVSDAALGTATSTAQQSTGTPQSFGGRGEQSTLYQCGG